MKSTYSTVSNPNRSFGHPIRRSIRIQRLYHFFPLYHFPKHHVIFIQPRCQTSCNKELRIIAIWSTIRHGKHSDLIVLMNEILIGEGIPVYTLPTSSITVGYIPTLNHKPRYNPMKSISFIVKIIAALSFSFFPGAKTFKIFSCFRDVSVQLKYYFSLLHPIYSDLKKRTISLPIMHVPL